MDSMVDELEETPLDGCLANGFCNLGIVPVGHVYDGYGRRLLRRRFSGSVESLFEYSPLSTRPFTPFPCFTTKSKTLKESDMVEDDSILRVLDLVLRYTSKICYCFVNITLCILFLVNITLVYF